MPSIKYIIINNFVMPTEVEVAVKTREKKTNLTRVHNKNNKKTSLVQHNISTTSVSDLV